MATLLGSFGSKEVGLRSQNGNPIWSLSPNNFFEYKRKKKIP